MKRIPILVAATLVLGLPTKHACGQIGFALTGGINYGTLSVDGLGLDAQDVESVARLSTALTVTIPLSGRFGFELGGAYSRKGGRVHIETGLLTFRMNYYEMTALARANQYWMDNRIVAYAVAGPSVAWESSCHGALTASLGDSPPFDDVRTCNEDLFHNRDFGLAGGGGLGLELSENLGVTVGAVYTYGLRNLLREEDGHLKHRVLSVRAGFVYWIG